MPRLGIITPASNTNAEPTTYAMIAGLAGVTAHFSRFALPPTRYAPIGADALAPAAGLLAEAGVDVLVFHGTAGSWNGLEADRELCRELERATGIPTTTASLATVAALKALGARDVSVLFPGPAWVTEAIAAEYAREGLRVAHTAGIERFDSNLAIGGASPAEVEAIVALGIVGGVDAVAVIGTNLPATHLVDGLERRHDATIVDSTAATTWQLLRLAGVDARLSGWGRLFRAEE